MKFSISALVFAAAVPAYAGIVTRVEGDVTNVPTTWLSIEEGVTYRNSTSLVPRTGTEVVTCYGTGTTAPEISINSVIDDWCSRVIGTTVVDQQTVWARYSFGSFTVYVSGEAINTCTFVIDGNCNRLLRLPVDGCNTNTVTAKQGGYETDACGVWRTDPGSNGSEF